VILRDALPYARAFAGLLREERAEVVHFNSARGIILAGPGAHLAGKSAVMHQRGSVAVGPLYWMAAQSLADWILLVARALMPEVSPSARPCASVLYNGVNADIPLVDRAKARADLARKIAGRMTLDQDATLFVSLSSPTPFKGLHHLVEAAAIARARGVRAAYVLAGEPKAGYAAWLQRKIDAEGLGGTVALVGFVDDTHSLLCAADALVLPSVEHERIEDGGEVYEDHSNEGLPRAILEAMAAGIPAIASDIAGVSEQIEDGVSGLVVPQKDPARLAHAIERVARDPEFRARSGAAAREVVRARFRIEDAAQGLVETLARVAAQPAPLGRPLWRLPALAADALRGLRQRSRAGAADPGTRRAARRA
jgi:glycosyltransferase involved in cell wall biosynthesis